MAKLTGTIRITANAGSTEVRPHFEVVFVPYAGKLNTRPAKVHNHEELITLLMDLKIAEDEASRWAGKARAQGVVLISGVERTESVLRDGGLLA